MKLGKLTKLDKRWIFLMLIGAVILPQVVDFGTPKFEVTRESQSLYDTVDALPEGAPILISFDFDPGSKPELYPAATAILKHALRKKLRVIMMGLWAPGIGMSKQLIREVTDEHYGSREEAEKHYGEDFVFLGWRPGLFAVIVKVGEGIQAEYKQDSFYRKSTANMPVFDGVTKLADLSLVITISAGSPGIEEWLQYGQGKYDIKLGGAVTAVAAPAMIQFLNTGQLVGLLGGMKGAADYEKLADAPGDALKGLNVLTASHLLIIALIIFSNVVYFASLRKT